MSNVTQLFAARGYRPPERFRQIEARRAAIQHFRELEVKVILTAREVIAQADDPNTAQAALLTIAHAWRKIEILGHEEQLLDVPQ